MSQDVVCHNRDIDWLTEYMLACQSMNQKNMAALYRAILRVSPMANVDNAILIVDVMRLTVRLGLERHHPATFSAVRHHFDRACTKTFLHFKANGQTVTTWWDSYKDIAGLILDTSAVEKILACKEDFATVKDILQMVVNSSELGEKMFGRACVAARSADVATLMQDSLVRLGSKDIAKDDVDKARTRFVEACKELGKDPAATFEKPKETIVKYRGVGTPVIAKSLLQQWSFHVEAFVRTVAVETGDLVALWCESDLVPPPDVPFAIKVDKALVKQSASARQSCHEMLEKDVATLLTVCSLLKKKEHLLRQMDRFFKIEESFYTNMKGDVADGRVQKSSFGMPSESGSGPGHRADAAEVEQSGRQRSPRILRVELGGFFFQCPFLRGGLAGRSRSQVPDGRREHIHREGERGTRTSVHSRLRLLRARCRLS